VQRIASARVLILNLGDHVPMKRPKLRWLIAGTLFALASVAIHYEVKVVMHQRGDALNKLGTVQLRDPATEFMRRNVPTQPFVKD
jgi:hypothetical protein